MGKNWFSENIIDLGKKDDPVDMIRPKAPRQVTDLPPVQKAEVTYKESVMAAPVPSDDLEKFRKHFADLTVSNNQPGNDYFEFEIIKNSMNSVIPVEAVRYQAAFAGLAAQGLTKSIIEATAGVYSTLIDKEMSDFEKSYQDMLKQQVDGVSDQMNGKVAEMKTLSEKLAALNDEVNAMAEKVKQNKANLTMKNAAFKQAGQEAKEQITSELQKINSYIP